MYVNLLDYIGTIQNKQSCINELRSRVKSLKNLPDNKVGFKVNQSFNSDFRYFTDDYTEVEEASPDKVWMWVDSGFKDKNNNVMYFQFRCTSQGNIGAFVGTEEDILNNQMRVDGKTYKITSLDVEKYKNDIEEENAGFYTGLLSEEIEALKKQLTNNEVTESENKQKQEDNIKEVNISSPKEEKSEINPNTSKDTKEEQSIISNIPQQTPNAGVSSRDNTKSDTCSKSLYENIYSRLLIQSGWEVENSTLQKYINTVIARLNHLLSRNEDCSKYLIYSKNKDYVLVNTALLDKFGKTIILICKVNSNGEIMFTGSQIMDGRQMLLKLGFEKDSILGINIERVRFYNESNSEFVFHGDIEEFDFDSWDRLVHCIDDRRERFPDEYKDMPSEVLCSDMVKAIELGVTLSKYDSGYIKPIYNRKFDRIHFVVPFHLGNNFRKKPELGIVIANFDNTFWQVMTILEYNNCQADTRVLNLYSDEYID